jgi:hypothetical protein
LAGERNVSQYMLQAELHPPNDYPLRKIWSKRLSKTGAYSHAIELNFQDVMSPFLAATVKFDLEDPIAAKLFQSSEERWDSVGRDVNKFPDGESTPTVVGAPTS